ncbi:MAG: PEP-CTERM sorting domain-containing protein [Sedimentisphaerales bacterium]|nr:PEP-CTERM sorting domain-containing protein [Sedimentisphaerales bacterium]
MSTRKILVNSIVFLLLVMPSLAHGEVILTLWGEEAPDPPKRIIWLCGGIEPMGMNLLAGHAIECYDLAFVLVDLDEEYPSEPGFVFRPDWIPIEFPTIFDIPAQIIFSDEQYVRIAAAQILSPAVLGPAVLVDNLCVQNLVVFGLSRLDIVVEGLTIIDGEEIPVGTVLDSTIVYEIPEPATFALLGLSALLIRRRRI